MNIDFIKKLLSEPEEVIEQMDLVYVNNAQLTIQRIPKQKDFDYIFNGLSISKKSKLERLKSIVIPPAWENVKITHLHNGHLQAVGRDAKNRKQYRYHPKWVKLRSQTKFYKMSSFGRELPKIRERVEADLEQDGWPKSKVLALVIRLMEETHIRIGNEQYAKRNRTYGLTTLRTKHLSAYNDKLRFEFVGKKGKEHKVTLRNKKLIRMVHRMEELPGWELFQFYDKEGQKQSIDSTMINNYLHTISANIFSAKDFRTWAASIIFFENLNEMKSTKIDKIIEKNLLTAFDATAKELGNTRNVCRKSYVHPLLVETYRTGDLETYFKKANETQQLDDYFSPSEVSVLKLIDSYQPEVITTL